ncbi:DUF2182 domain-containing protein [Microvirga sp. G4-2]|uniref:DUF2182 domain-containing protein n=1 Tax=Microvirga sp. G4-2 TaxID=3434467 RepID=UPI00404447E3
MSETSVLASVLRRDRLIVIGGLLGVVALSWLYLFQRTGMDMQAMGDMVMPMTPMPWPPGYFGLIVAMWVVMMAAMMLPSAAPVILLYATIARRRRQQSAAAPAAGFFALGYVAVWAVFGLLAATLQWGLDAALLLSPLMATTSVAVAGLVLVAAGLYQWTPLKQACLRQCRSPLDFLLVHWRAGARGAVAMGARHGLFCLGCCGILMLLLFVGGVMNLLWIAVLTLVVLIEKTAPGGHWIGRAAGAALMAWGGATLLSLV